MQSACNLVIALIQPSKKNSEMFFNVVSDSFWTRSIRTQRDTEGSILILVSVHTGRRLATMVVGSVFTCSSCVLILLLQLLLQPCFFFNMEKITNIRFSTGSLKESPGIIVVKMSKIGHINANGIVGFKFHDIRKLATVWKIRRHTSHNRDELIASAMANRDLHDGGLMIFIWNGICFHLMTRFHMNLSSFRTESSFWKSR